MKTDSIKIITMESLKAHTAIMTYTDEKTTILKDINKTFSPSPHTINRNTSYKIYLYKELLLTLITKEPHAYNKRTRSFHFSDDERR